MRLFAVLHDSQFIIQNMLNLKTKIREIPDFPKKGVNFKDITPLLEDPKYFQKSINLLTKKIAEKITERAFGISSNRSCHGKIRQIKRKIKEKKKKKLIDKIVAIDARGFLIASALAYKLGAGIVIARKKGKLPSETISCEYDLEYGKETLEIHRDSIKPGEKILIVDDVLATGGTALATSKLVEKLKGEIIGIAFLIELAFLGGREKLKTYKVNSLLKYES